MARQPQGTRTHRPRASVRSRQQDWHQEMLSQALTAIPDDAGDDDWTVAVFSGGDPHGPRHDLYDRLEWIFLTWAWFAGHRSWYAGVRALARALRGLEESGLIERNTRRPLGDRPRRVWSLTEDGRDVVAALTGEVAR